MDYGGLHYSAGRGVLVNGMDIISPIPYKTRHISRVESDTSVIQETNEEAKNHERKYHMQWW